MNPEPQVKSQCEEKLRNRCCVVLGTRPDIVMMGPIIRELQRRGMAFFVIHTGQHYSYNMDRQFFLELQLNEPEYRLDSVQYCTLHGEQTAEVLKGVEQILLEERPDIVLVGGDVDSSMAAALAARKLHLKIGHVEAGERSGDWRMPEEHNRVIIDHISEYLFATNETSKRNLIADGVKGQIFITGNPVADAAIENLEIAERTSAALDTLKLTCHQYLLMTLHREENVDNPENLKGSLEGAGRTSERVGLPVIFLIHPRTLKRLKEFELSEWAAGISGLRIHEPVGYLDFLTLLAHARLALTDSGGVQKETCVLKVPCVTLRENTEWPETVAVGANRLAGTEPDRIVAAVEEMLNGPIEWDDQFGDGHAARHILDIIQLEAQK